MKNRRLAITALLLLLAVALGIGYATFVDTLTVRGTAKANSSDAANAFEQDVYFTAAEIIKGSADTSVDNAVITSDNDIVSLTAGSLATAGDTVGAKYTIVNDSEDLGAALAAAVVNNGDPTNFNVTYYLSHDANAATGTQNIEIAAGGTVYLFVTVELLNTPTHLVSGGSITPVEWTAQFDFTFNVTSVE